MEPVVGIKPGLQRLWRLPPPRPPWSRTRRSVWLMGLWEAPPSSGDWMRVMVGKDHTKPPTDMSGRCICKRACLGDSQGPHYYVCTSLKKQKGWLWDEKHPELLRSLLLNYSNSWTWHSCLLAQMWADPANMIALSSALASAVEKDWQNCVCQWHSESCKLWLPRKM